MKFKIQGAPELAARIRRALDQQDIAGGDLDLTFSPELLVQDVSKPPFVQEPVYFAAPESAGPVAAEFSHAGIHFNGPGLLVVDKVIAFCPTAAVTLTLRFGRNVAALAGGISTNIHDRADLRGIGVDTIAMSSVQGIQDTDVVQQGTLIAYASSNAAGEKYTFTDLDCVLAAGDELFIVAGTVNLIANATFFGRWFPQAVTS